jgi:hypothetical protein
MWILLWVLIPSTSHADMNQCVREVSQDKKNYCMASYAGSAAFCDKISSYELRTQCMRMVIAKQREATYQTPRPPTKEETK